MVTVTVDYGASSGRITEVFEFPNATDDIMTHEVLREAADTAQNEYFNARKAGRA